ncbi:11058_t:CDS:2 [Diversispora eburnea]|uniref:Patatin-like phospholipase domain-containing protein n=1 Tax=Diversispora eburnea TaxID=1213867 RepID=A0A9N9ACR0_9GLOM|nr:11058_t:CDS:2 [Diversispora eburnea]
MSPTHSPKHSRTKKYAHHTQNYVNEFSLEFLDESHIEAFEKALAKDPEEDDLEHISAISDFMPIRQKVKRKKPKVPSGFEGISYHIVRFPMMLIIFIIITIELLLYFLVRQIVNLWEYFVQWRGKKYFLREKLRQTTTYEEWVDSAKKLDNYFNYDEWKGEIPFGYYNFNLIQKVNRDLINLKSGPNENPARLKSVLLDCVKNNFAGVENVRLYSQTYYVTEALDHLRTTKSLSNEEKRRLFKYTHKNYGRTALCLSGGAVFGYYHLGVVKALFDADALPTVLTGTSAGALIAALVGVRKDFELSQVLKPELSSRLTACAEGFPGWFIRWWRTGARFDAVDWARKIQWVTKGSLTFREAYERTGRILNISVIPYDPHSPSKVLNYITAPDCVIWSAVIASAAVPGILKPVVLMQKSKNGNLVPYNYGHKWKDGSLRTDIPTQPLHMHFNVKSTIVSQMNPHVHLFFYAPRGSIGRPVSHRLGRGWRGGFLLASVEQYLKLDLSKWLKWIRDLELLPNIADQNWSSIWLQKFDGNVTIWPKSNIWDFLYILTDPTWERLSQMIRVGQRATWPKLHMIANRLRIERAIQKGRAALRREERKRHNKNRNWDNHSNGGTIQNIQNEDSTHTNLILVLTKTDSDSGNSIGDIRESVGLDERSSLTDSTIDTSTSSSSDSESVMTPEEGQDLL